MFHQVQKIITVSCFRSQPGSNYPLGTTGTEPRAYEGIGEQIKQRNEKKTGKFSTKYKIVFQKYNF
jgi:hypothetical protein